MYDYNSLKRDILHNRIKYFKLTTFVVNPFIVLTFLFNVFFNPMYV